MQKPDLWSHEAERSVCGAILVDPGCLHEIGDILRPEHFTHPATRAIYRAAIGLSDYAQEIDLLTVAEALGRDPARVPEGGWHAYLIGLLVDVPTSVHARSYAEIVADYAMRRDLVAAAGQIATAAYDVEQPARQLQSDAAARVLELAGRYDTGSLLLPHDWVADYLASLDQEDSERVATPLVGWNQLLLGGLASPHTHILAARAKMGKSALATQQALHSCKAGLRIYLATTEMSSRQFARRFVAQDTGIPAGRLAQRNLSPDEWRRAMESAGRLSECGPVLDVSTDLTPLAIRARATRVAATSGLDLIVVDHLHEMTSDQPRQQRHLELGDMARSIRDTGKSLGVPVLLVAQLSRNTDNRGDRRPQLTDLREAGALEEVAYSVTFIYRASYYTDGGGAIDPDVEAWRDPAEIIVAAHRDGPTGKTFVEWNGPVMRYEEKLIGGQPMMSDDFMAQA